MFFNFKHKMIFEDLSFSVAANTLEEEEKKQ